MEPEHASKIVSLMREMDGLLSRDPDEKKFREWKEKVEKEIEEGCGKNSVEYIRFRGVKFFDFSGAGRSKDSPLSERERREFFGGLDEAKRVLSHCI